MTLRYHEDAFARPVSESHATSSEEPTHSVALVAQPVAADSVRPSPRGTSGDPPLDSLLRFGASRRRRRHIRMLSAFAKRLVDIVISAALLVVAMPIMLAAAAMIYLTSRGPIIYTQERCGLHRRSFRILKFRSMVVDADERVDEMSELAEVADMSVVDAPAFKSAEDPRVTRIGRLLRRTSIDELPQLINVLRGDMSLVGPRPLVPAEVDALSPVEAYRRHSVRPGLTCLWQVLREDHTTFMERVHLDLLYVSRRSMALDIALMARTPNAILGGSGSF